MGFGFSTRDEGHDGLDDIRRKIDYLSADVVDIKNQMAVLRHVVDAIGRNMDAVREIIALQNAGMLKNSAIVEELGNAKENSDPMEHRFNILQNMLFTILRKGVSFS
jgi:hypothetical protein